MHVLLKAFVIYKVNFYSLNRAYMHVDRNQFALIKKLNIYTYLNSHQYAACIPQPWYSKQACTKLCTKIIMKSRTLNLHGS